MRRTIMLLLSVLVAGAVATGQAYAGVNARIGYLVPNFQVLPIGDIIDREVIDEATEIGLEDMNEFFYIEIQATEDMLDIPVVIEITEQLGAQTLIRFVSSSENSFTLRQWIDGTRQGYIENDEFVQLEDADWFYTDYSQTYYAETADILQLIEDGNLVRSSLVISLFVKTLDGTPLAAFTQTVEVYNPNPPQLMSPSNGGVIPDLPILFSWEWNGGMTMTADWTFFLVEGAPNADGQTVIEERNDLNTIFEGSPTSTMSHFYSHMSNRERALELGHTYYWMLEVDVPTALPGNEIAYTSDIYSFQFGETGGRPLLELISPVRDVEVFNLPIVFEWDYEGFQSQRRDWEIQIARCDENEDPVNAIDNPRNRLFAGQPHAVNSHLLNRSNFDRDEPTRICWRVRVQGDFDSGWLESEVETFYYAGERGRGGGMAQGGGPDRQQGSQQGGQETGEGDPPQQGGQRSASGEPGAGGQGQPPRNIMTDPVFDVLSNVLTPTQLATLMIDLRGYSHKDIVIEGINGQAMGQLAAFLQQHNFRVKQIRIVAE